MFAQPNVALFIEISVTGPHIIFAVFNFWIRRVFVCLLVFDGAHHRAPSISIVRMETLNFFFAFAGKEESSLFFH